MSEEINSIIKVGFSGGLGFAIGYLVGETAGVPVLSGATLGIASAAGAALKKLVEESAKKYELSYSVTEAAKSGVLLLTKTAGRIGLIALHVLYPGKVTGASIWTGSTVIIGIAQIAFTLLLQQAAEVNDWNYSTVLLGECALSALADAASTITLVAVGILAPTGAGIGVAVGISLLILSTQLFSALYVKYGGEDSPYRSFITAK